MAEGNGRRCREACLKAVAVIQAREDDGSDPRKGRIDGEERSVSSILKTEAMGYPNGLGSIKERAESKNKVFDLSNWGMELTITKMKAKYEADWRRKNGS